MRAGASVVCLVLAGLTALVLPGAAFADHPQPAPDIGAMDYTPIGQYGPAGQTTVVGGATPSATLPPYGPLAPTGGLKFNPSGKYVAYDTNLYEELSLPFRAAGDTSASDPPGPGGVPTDYGKCDPLAPPDPDGFAPLTAAAGRCPNHHLEYLDYFEETMKDILGPFGVSIKRYPFQSPGAGNTKSGQAHNVAAVVPGADHPEETVIVSGHYDQTTEGPASAWDSAEGHAEVIRMAKIMADYWTATGTRPSATIKFAPWDQEESGLLGSIDYVANNIPPGEEDEVRGYFNVDPCAGAYPSFYRGDPLDRVPMSLQLVNPDDHADDADFLAEINAFNARAETVVDEVFDNLDDTLATAPGSPEIFVSDQEAATSGGTSQRGEVQTALGGLLLFTSDYRSFERIGVPFFNLSPAFFGPSANGDPNREDGLAILHTPNDNHKTINALTSVDQTGRTVSEGWAKGMELCAQIETWYMLQPEMAGGQTTSTDVVAYYEALPNEAAVNQDVTFDAAGSHQLDGGGVLRDESELRYEWDFGDGTPSGTGRQVQHSYDKIGRYVSTLTVTNIASPGESDTMTIPITVIGSNFRPPVLDPLPETDPDGSFPLAWEFDADRDGFEEFSVEEASDYRILFSDDAEAGPTAKWSVSDPANADVAPWQPSDSATRKLRGNQSSSGARSFWTGVSPSDWPGPKNETSILTMNDPIAVPASGDPILRYASLFQNEGDDQGRVEVATTDGTVPVEELDWQPVDIVAATRTALGTTDNAICNPSEPETFTTGFEKRTADLAGYKGRTILVRFVYSLGPDDRLLSQPCGWYVDDVAVGSGTFSEIATTTDQSFTVTGRQPGDYAYRILGVYTDGIKTRPSNVEVISVLGNGGGGGGSGGGSGGGGSGGGGGGGSGGGSGNGGGGDRCANRLAGTNRADRLNGSNGSDLILGKAGRDRINGKRGDDCLRGGKGRDRIGGNAGDDKIGGGRGRDRIKGGGGDDVIRGGPKPDRIAAGKGNDVIHAAGGARDRINCGAGTDTVFADRSKDKIGKSCERVRSQRARGTG